MRLADCRLRVAWMYDADYGLQVLGQVLHCASRKYVPSGNDSDYFNAGFCSLLLKSFLEATEFTSSLLILQVLWEQSSVAKLKRTV